MLPPKNYSGKSIGKVCIILRRLLIRQVRQCEIHMQQSRPNCCKTWLSKFPTRSKRIDVISRITFPLVFALFNLIYWSTYLFREDTDES